MRKAPDKGGTRTSDCSQRFEHFADDLASYIKIMKTKKDVREKSFLHVLPINSHFAWFTLVAVNVIGLRRLVIQSSRDQKTLRYPYTQRQNPQGYTLIIYSGIVCRRGSIIRYVDVSVALPLYQDQSCEVWLYRQITYRKRLLETGRTTGLGSRSIS